VKIDIINKNVGGIFMAVRRQRATTSAEIMDKDIKIVIKKSKVRYRSVESKSHGFVNEFWIEKIDDLFFSGGKISEERIYQHWKFNFDKNKWECIEDKSKN